MTDKEKLLKMDEIRRNYCVDLNNIKILTEEDVEQDAMYTPSIIIARKTAKYHNCLMEMIKVLYNITEYEE